MIDTQQIRHVSQAIQQKAVGGRVWRVNETEYRYYPKDKSKATRIIDFLPNGRVLCMDLRGVSCKANYFERPCYHVLRVALFIARSQFRRERREANAA